MGKCNKASPIFKLKAMFTIKDVKRHRMVCIGVAGSNILAHHFLLQLSMAQRRSKSEPPKKSFAEDPSRLFRPNIHPMPAETLPPMSTVDKRWSATPRRGDISRRLLPIAYAFSGEQCLEMSIDFTHTTLDVELAISQYFFPYTINVVFPSSQSFDDNFFFLCASQGVTEVQIVIDSKFDFMWSGCSSERMM